MIFATWMDAVLWAFEQLECDLRAQKYERETTGNASYGKGDAYHDALEIKSQYDHAARLFGAEDDRGNWILVKVLPSQSPVYFRPWELRKLKKATEHLEETLEKTGFLNL